MLKPIIPCAAPFEHGETRRVQFGAENRSASAQNSHAADFAPIPEPFNGTQRMLLNAQASRNLQSQDNAFQTFK